MRNHAHHDHAIHMGTDHTSTVTLILAEKALAPAIDLNTPMTCNSTQPSLCLKQKYTRCLYRNSLGSIMLALTSTPDAKARRLSTDNLQRMRLVGPDFCCHRPFGPPCTSPPSPFEVYDGSQLLGVGRPGQSAALFRPPSFRTLLKDHLISVTRKTRTGSSVQ